MMDVTAAYILGKLIGAGLAMIGAIGAGAGIGIVASGGTNQLQQSDGLFDLRMRCGQLALVAVNECEVFERISFAAFLADFAAEGQRLLIVLQGLR